MTHLRSDQLLASRCWDRNGSVVFRKTNEEFGGLSNMAGGFPLCVNDVFIQTAEALYQACRFPHRPEVQRLILDQKSPMTAKMKGKPHRSDTRPDWDEVRIAVMRWCLRVKLTQHRQNFGQLLIETGDRPIVEESRRDTFWGAKSDGERALLGENVLGRLLMELREHVTQRTDAYTGDVDPPTIARFLLLGRPIGHVGPSVAPCASMDHDAQTTQAPTQGSLLEQGTPCGITPHSDGVHGPS